MAACHSLTYFALDRPHDGFGSPDSCYVVGLETFGVVEGVHIWRGYLPLCAVDASVVVGDYLCCLPFEADYLLPGVVLDEVVPPFPCEGPPFVPGPDVRHDYCRLRDGEKNLFETRHHRSVVACPFLDPCRRLCYGCSNRLDHLLGPGVQRQQPSLSSSCTSENRQIAFPT